MAKTPMNMAVLVALMVVVVLAAMIHCSAAQTVHVVGGDMGWGIPDGGFVTYATWVATQKFTVGDILEFNFTTGKHDVAQVTWEAFLLCNTTTPTISLTKTGPANITLKTAGEYYFFCTFAGHCDAGQRVALNVTEASSPTPPPASAPAPKSAPTPAPSRSPVNYTVGDGMGWVIPPGGAIAYQTWAYNKTFLVGDALVFNFAEKVDDVAEVTKTAFETCNSSTTISTYTTSPTRITLNTTGEHFYMSTFPNYCLLGQKLAINVTSSSTSTPPPKSAPTPAPSRSPVNYTVGDGMGWLIPPGGAIAYQTWAYNKTFLVGDTLVFNFTEKVDDVAEVTKTAFTTCNSSTTISTYTTSPTRITLNTTGEHFYVSTFPNHCLLGQKLAINVTSSSTATPPSSSATPPSRSPSPSYTTAPASPRSHAPSFTAAAGFSVTFLSIVVAYLIY